MASLRNFHAAMNPTTSRTPAQTFSRRTVYLPDRAWEMASRKAAELNLSTSQLLAQLILETVESIDPRYLLSRIPADSTTRS
jgi:hypothetical protein